MRDTWQDRLLWRELGNRLTHSSIKGVYGDKSWIDDLDVVNELGGHSGCVNTLSWSSSGRLLASGSDDQHINIHSYQSETSTSPFSLTTTVATGHMANIFCVKFMPQSNDRTLVTAAGDAEVRVFDIEYSGGKSGAATGVDMASTARSQRFHNTYEGVRYLSDGNTNARIYRSHADRVKRIVTENSPNLFLTCSEDGEVRQFDLRLPSSAYPPSRGGRGFLAHRSDHDNSNVPPPLISYKRFDLDLNAISCSPSRPHYIALGGAHLHCFLHDRRMLGRDVGVERGNPGRASPAASMSSGEEDLMGQATRCVRKFAPDGRKKMRRTDNGHITACKISDANPNEMVASWSGDHIYSFDLIRSPDANDPDTGKFAGPASGKSKGKARDSGNGSRKRKQAPSTKSLEPQRKGAKSRSSARNKKKSDMALRVRYVNGQSEDIAMSDVAANLPSSTIEDAREAVLTDSQKRSLRIAKSSVKIRSLIFSLESSSHNAERFDDVTAHLASFTAALGFAATCLPEMKAISSSWRYPVNPLREDVMLQQTLRGNRTSAQHFVQAAGTLARTLGGRLQTSSRTPSPALDLFQSILPMQGDKSPFTKQEFFSYTFLKAIILWLDGGTQLLLQGFKRPPEQRRESTSFPIADDAGESAIDDVLIPHLLRMAGDHAIPNVDASRFERDETRKIFPSETAAVIAFSNAICIPVEDLSRAIVVAPSNADGERRLPAAQNKKTVVKYWGFKVGRGLLMSAGARVNFQFVDTAFGGLGNAEVEDQSRLQDDVDPDEEDPLVESFSTVGSSLSNGQGLEEAGSGGLAGPDINVDDARSDAEVILMDDLHDEIVHRMAAEDERDEMGDDNNEEGDEEGDGFDDDQDITAEERSFMFQSASDRGRLREVVEEDVPCFSSTRLYRGHCNVKTVKDVNFFGLQDEYVVSGSDCGHLFIWDKKTSQLVNILKGDDEVVNVVQGHPYEPVLAASGIDHTIKIFSPDARAQEDAKNGNYLSSTIHGSHGYSSLSPASRRALRLDEDDTQRTSRKRMHQSYQIVSQNDVQRQGGIRETYITRGMLAQLAARLRARQGGAEGEGGGGVRLGNDGEAIVVDDDCLLM